MNRNRSLALAAALALPAAGIAQLPVVHLNGNVYDGNGGPFVAGFVYHIISNTSGCCATVPTGQVLTVLPGAIVKVDISINVRGRLIADGATFTSWHDDSVGGDSNNNGGLTVPSRGDWDRIEFGGAGSVAQDCTFRYAGRGTGPAGMTLWFRSAAVTLRRSIIEQSAGAGIDLEGSFSTVADTLVRHCGGRALRNGWFPGVMQLRNITAHDCAGGNYAHFLYGGTTWSGLVTVAVQPLNSVNGTGVHVLETYFSSGLHVPVGATLDLSAGTIFKFVRGYVTLDGTLLGHGTATDPVVFTSLEDDSYGGDTNLDGNATQPTPGDWNGITLQAGADQTTLDHTKVLWGGGGGASSPSVYANSSSVTMRDCEVAHAPGDGIFVRGGSIGTVALQRCRLHDNGGLGLTQMRWWDLAASADNVLANNAGGNHVIVQGGLLATAVDGLTPANIPGTLVLGSQLTITASGSLTIPRGTVVKLTTLGGFAATGGALRFLGTAFEPIVLTSIHDDSVGGDTNGNGNATVPARGDWSSVHYSSTSPQHRVEHTRLRFGGGASTPVLNAATPIAVHAAHVSYAALDGIELHGQTQDVSNVVVHHCGRDGIHLRSGTFNVLHATVADNTGVGIRRSGQVGQVRNSVAWNNGGGNFAGLAVANVHFCNGGFAGQNGNLSVAPQFVNPTAGDYRLGAGSPILGVADFGSALLVAADADEGSRITDHALAGVPAPDMGAYERATYALAAQGTPRLGQSLTFTLQGPAGIGVLILGFLDQTVFVPPFGVELAGVSGVGTLGGLLATGQPAMLTVPSNQQLLGLLFGIQGLVLPATNLAVGNFTNRYRGMVF